MFGLAFAALCSIHTPVAFSATKSPLKFSEGGVDGGGGYADENSTKFLLETAETLIRTLKNGSQQVLAVTPNNWKAAEISTVLGNIRLSPLENRQRNGRPLMFDYDVATNQIIALAPYFASYEFVEASKYNNEDLVRGLRTKLLHETAHLWGANEEQAEKQALAILDGFDHDLVYCLAPGWETDVFRSQNLVLNLGTGIFVFEHGDQVNADLLAEGMRGPWYQALNQYGPEGTAEVLPRASGDWYIHITQYEREYSLIASPRVKETTLSYKYQGATTTSAAACTFHFHN